MSDSEIIVCAYCKKPILAREAYVYHPTIERIYYLYSPPRESVKCVIGENSFKVKGAE